MRSFEHIQIKTARGTLQFSQRGIVGVLGVYGKVEHRNQKTGIEQPPAPRQAEKDLASGCQPAILACGKSPMLRSHLHNAKAGCSAAQCLPGSGHPPVVFPGRKRAKK